MVTWNFMPTLIPDHRAPRIPAQSREVILVCAEKYIVGMGVA